MSEAATRRRILVLGGARSGKSTFAEKLAAEMGGPVTYVAVATVTDEEMAERIRIHRERRPAEWETVEEPLRPSHLLAGVAGTTVLVEDLTLLLSNLMGRRAEDPEPLDVQAEAAQVEAFEEIDRLAGLGSNLVLVSNEVGMGIVPPHPVSRAFRDALGRVNQHAASVVDEVYLVVAGLPVRLKPGAT